MIFNYYENECPVVLTKEEVIELKLLRDILSRPLVSPGLDHDLWLKMERFDKCRWLELVEKILSQIK